MNNSFHKWSDLVRKSRHYLHIRQQLHLGDSPAVFPWTPASMKGLSPHCHSMLLEIMVRRFLVPLLSIMTGEVLVRTGLEGTCWPRFCLSCSHRLPCPLPGSLSGPGIPDRCHGHPPGQCPEGRWQWLLGSGGRHPAAEIRGAAGPG